MDRLVVDPHDQSYFSSVLSTLDYSPPKNLRAFRLCSMPQVTLSFSFSGMAAYRIRCTAQEIFKGWPSFLQCFVDSNKPFRPQHLWFSNTENNWYFYQASRTRWKNPADHHVNSALFDWVILNSMAIVTGPFLPSFTMECSEIRLLAVKKFFVWRDHLFIEEVWCQSPG